MLKEDIQSVDVTEENARDGMRWRWSIHFGDPYEEQLKEKEKDFILFKINIFHQ